MSTSSSRLADPGAADTGVLQVLDYVAPRLRPLLRRLLPLSAAGARWLEIRLRLGRPLNVVTEAGDLWVGPEGPAAAASGAVCCVPEDVERSVQLVTRASVYAWEDELAHGFCTLPGGHRAGLCGSAIRRAGRIAGQKAFGSLNLRIARAVPGAADPLLPLLARGGTRRIPGILLYGPPGCGKTTVLRDLCRQLGEGRAAAGVPALRVAIVDERSEIAACVDGRPQFDLGPRTDVLDAAPKAEGLPILLRALNPEVVACDEIGGPGDARALAEVARCGVAVLATAHAGSAEDLRARPSLRAALRTGAFDIAVRLREDRTPGEALALSPARPAPVPLRAAAGRGGRTWPRP